jgi:hypothetical protein
VIARELGALASECVLACQLIEPASGREVVVEALISVLDGLERQEIAPRQPALVLVEAR